MRGARRARGAALAAALSLAAGCIPFVGKSPVKVRGYALWVAEQANDRSPVAVDVVVVTEEELVKPIAKLSAAEWFATKGQLLLDHPRGLQVTSLEPVPGQTLPYTRLRWRGKAQGAFVFAGYPAPGDHRVRVDPYPWIGIRLTADSLAVTGAGRP